MKGICFGRSEATFRTQIRRAPGNVFDFFIPQRCLLCTEVIVDSHVLCGGCEGELPYNDASCSRCAAIISAGELCGNCLREPPPFDCAFVPLRYHYPIDHLVRRLKYAEDPATGRLLGRFMAEELLATRCTPLPEALIPIPLHPGRLRERGYNQALEICRSIADRTGIPIESALLSRQRATPPQVGMRRNDRERNMRNAFRLERSPGFRHIALIDDVITSGATMRAAARTLRAGGASRIESWSLARA